jgi:hypothetical protein
LLVPLVFPFGIAIAGLWRSLRDRGRAVSFTLLAASVMIALAFALGGRGLLAYNAEIGHARWLDWASPLVDLPAAFPSFFRGKAIGEGTDRLIGATLVWPAFAWALALAIGWAACLLLDARLNATLAVRALIAPACLAVACALGAGATWAIAGGAHVTATRAQLALLDRQDPRRLSLGVQLLPLRRVPSGDVPSRLALTTQSFDAPEPAPLLYLEEVPPGDYRVRVTRKPNPAGELRLGIGRATLPAARWPAAADQSIALSLPVRASILTITGDAAARQSVEEIALVPEPVPRDGRGDAKKVAPLSDAGTARARDAARYGDAVVMTLDDRVWLEPNGFWVMGARDPEVVIAIAPGRPSAALDLRNTPVMNRVRLSSGSWSSARTLGPNEQWHVDLPLESPRHAAIVRLAVERGVVPAEIDPQSGDHRSLGCWVQVR